MGAKYPYYLLADSPEGRAKESEITRTPPPDRPNGPSRSRPMPPHIRRGNASRSSVRAAIEHVFARPKGPMALCIRTIGIARARVKIGLATSPTTSGGWPSQAQRSNGMSHRPREEAFTGRRIKAAHDPMAMSRQHHTCLKPVGRGVQMPQFATESVQFAVYSDWASRVARRRKVS
jgi:hypothetical protein